MLDKKVEVNGYEYQFTIRKINEGYQVTLTPMFSKAVKHCVFRDLQQLKENLENWVLTCHAQLFKNEESDFFNELREWDGVIHV